MNDNQIPDILKERILTNAMCRTTLHRANPDATIARMEPLNYRATVYAALRQEAKIEMSVE